MTKNLQAISIRIAAQDIVGPCSDYQIMFCGSAKGIISTMTATLEELPDTDLKRLADWIIPGWTSEPAKSEWDTYRKYV